MSALQDVIVDQPEAADQKGAFSSRQPVAGLFRVVAQNEFAIDQQTVLDRSQCSLHAPIVCRKEADKRDQQQAGIESLGAIGLHKTFELRVKSALADFGMNVIGNGAPASG